MKLERYVHLITLEIPIKIDCEDYFLVSRQDLDLDIHYHLQYKTLSLIVPDLDLYILSESMFALLHELNGDIAVLWRAYVKEKHDLTLDGKRLSRNLEETFKEISK